jgi:8-oxo-dGTP pyrophosphatase MutT (NUDIX family)
MYRGAIWSIQRDAFEFGDEILVRDFMRHMGAVAILAINEQEEILTIRQYRHPVGMDMIEIPAGLIDAVDEVPLEAAQRELFEETGYMADDWKVLVDMCNSPGSSTETLRIYLARGLTRGEWRTEDLSGEEKEIQQSWIPVPDALAHILAGRWQSPTAVAGVLSYVASRGDALRDASCEWLGRDLNVENGRIFEP